MTRSSSGELPRTAKAQILKLAADIGIADRLESLAFSLAIMSFGVPAGARMANQELKKKPADPDSETVGTSANCGNLLLAS